MYFDLRIILPQIEEYVKMIRAVFDVDVEVCDSKLIRIITTEENCSLMGKPLKGGRLSTKAMSEKKYVFACDPLTEEICQGCVNQATCSRFCSITFPLIYEDEAYGAINIIARTDEQEQTFFSRKDALVSFMQTICTLITLTVSEYLHCQEQEANLKMLNRLINVMSDGVIIMTPNNTVRFINERCSKIIGCNLRQIQYLQKINQFSIVQKKTDSGAQFEVRIREARFSLSGQLYLVNAFPNSKSDRIFVFYDVNALHDNLNQTSGLSKFTFDSLIGESLVFKHTVSQCKEASYSLRPILLSGESGTGKGHLAKAIHNESILNKRQFINFSVLGYGNLQAMLNNTTTPYNYKKTSQPYLENNLIFGNTLFISDISIINIETQQLLLDYIENGPSLHSRLICCSSRPLKMLLESGDFLPDLFYSLDVNTIQIPPLRARGNDIGLFIEHFLKKANKDMHKKLSFSKEVYTKLFDYSWPGNIRELENTISYLVEHTESDYYEIQYMDLPQIVKLKLDSNTQQDYNLERLEKQMIIKALNDGAGKDSSKKEIANALGISVATLYRKMEKYGIEGTNQYI